MLRPIALVTASLVGALLASPPAVAGDFYDKQLRYDRVRAAFADHEGAVRDAFRAARAAWPPRGLYLRAFKREGELEVWAAPTRGERLVLVRTIPVCARSGGLGPKTRSGDGQVPEGFYAIDRFNPRSAYHLSLGLDYPNALDRARAAAADAPPGGDIFIHGDCVTIGCLPLEDGPISWLYVAAVRARDAGQRRISVVVSPCRFGDAACDAVLVTDDDATRALWEALRRGDALFAERGVAPRVSVTKRGYTVR